MAGKLVLPGFALLALVCASACPGLAQAGSDDDFLDLSLEALMEIEVTSVSKQSQALHEAAAAIFVVTNEDMVQQGVTNVADALRRVPGLHVGRIDSNKWAVTSRGFNGRFSNKLLVLVDGRSVYTSAFSGVYWEVQDLMIEDIDRIEIIRGPGSTLWGANAVNGVINIITKHAADTQDGLLVAGAGNIEKTFGSVRWGTELSEGTFARVYGKAFARGEFTFPSGEDAGDDWTAYRAGFRLDSQHTASDAHTLQGDIYQTKFNQKTGFAQLTPPYALNIEDEGTASGGNLLGRWVHTVSSSSAYSAQVYFDRAVRDESVAYQAENQMDYDFQHYFAAHRQKIVWGLGYHYSSNDLAHRSASIQARENRALMLFSAFFQDEISLREDRLNLTLGSKIEHNDFTGVEIQPSARLMWRAHDAHRLWTAVSRAVRTPMRAEDEFEVLLAVVPPGSPTNPGPIPVGVVLQGTEDIEAEEVLAYELGYRFVQPLVSADVAIFYNDYSNLTTIEPGELDVRYLADPPYVAQPMIFENSDQVSDYGLELALAWKPSNWMDWDLAYTYLKNDTDDTGEGPRTEIFSPEHLLSVSFGLRPISAVEFNAGLRHVDESLARSSVDLDGVLIPSYTTVDVRLAWQMNEDLELSVVGQNLLEENHLEYTSESFTFATEVPRSFYGKVKWTF